MVEVDPVFLIVAGTAVLGLAVAIVLFAKPQTVPLERAPTVSSTKPKKKSKTTKSTSVAAVPAPVLEPVQPAKVEVEPTPAPVPAAKKKKSPAAVSIPAPVVPPVHVATVSSVEENVSVVEDPDEDEFLAMAIKKSDKNSKTKKAKATEKKVAEVSPVVEKAPVVAKKAETKAPVVSNEEYSIPESFGSDGWAVVDKKTKSKAKKGEEVVETVSPVTAATTPIAVPETKIDEAPATPPEPVIESVTQEVTVDAKKLGVIIGQKGATRIAISNVTGTEITMPKTEKDSSGPVIVTVTGPAQGVAKATKAINELCTKGYTGLIAGEDFKEETVPVHPMYLAEIIGKGGCYIKALQNHYGVKINTPNSLAAKEKPATANEPVTKVKISIAGPREKVVAARNTIKEIVKYFHSDVTHPGVIHLEMPVPNTMYNYIIGSKGSEIKHIQNSYKVSIHIPNANSVCQEVLIVGLPDNVAAAENHIIKLMEKVRAAKIAQEEARSRTTVDQFTPASRKAEPVEELNPEDAWMAEFAPRAGVVDIGSMLPAKYATSNGTANGTSSTPAVKVVSTPSEPIGLTPTPVSSETANKPAGVWGSPATF